MASVTASSIYNEDLMRRAREQAHAMKELSGYTRYDVMRELGGKSDFSDCLRRCYMSLMDFRDLDLVSAMRVLLQRIVLTGEAAEVDRVLYAFTERYHEQNEPDCTADAMHVLASATVLLNSDLHSRNRNGKPMTFRAFTQNLSGMMDGADFPMDTLRKVYDSIRNDELIHQTDDVQQAGGEYRLLTPARHCHNPLRASELDPAARSITAAPKRPDMFLRIFYSDEPIGPAKLTDFVVRKDLTTIGGTRCRRGQRGWHQLYAALHGHRLVFHEPKYQRALGTEINQTRPSARTHASSLPLDVTRACAALDYEKRDFVMRLRVGSGQSLLMQLPSVDALKAWIKAINRVAAFESAPPLPAPVTAARHGFRTPIMPESKTTETPIEMRARYRSNIARTRKQLQTHREREQEFKAEGRTTLEYWRDKLDFLEYDLQRQETYLRLLEDELGAAGQLASEAEAPDETVTFQFRHVSEARSSAKSQARSTLRLHSSDDSDRLSWV
ncbi:uncharacterized protein MONBRDRAFT_25239 [Monosiga brevicollis MX1]|uniref:SEC7 domain-containing protein n=1 Tax=Monosiga brevicollis TaxID=81824 RepID=A9UYT9_MONBE|nr:uncharacterized protein MONBRDRAFT_25239 [Monosiga brevicollis MX1]EDQ89664.1 predicted protein [Monosiga brevicollis MX1]|eukprot:XP_001745693.1 hypothetical protein [Monosiga brevicollis MX1]